MTRRETKEEALQVPLPRLTVEQADLLLNFTYTLEEAIWDAYEDVFVEREIRRIHESPEAASLPKDVRIARGSNDERSSSGGN